MLLLYALSLPLIFKLLQNNEKICMLLFLITIGYKVQQTMYLSNKGTSEHVGRKYLIVDQCSSTINNGMLIGKPLTHIFVFVLSILFRPLHTIRTTVKLHTI